MGTLLPRQRLPHPAVERTAETLHGLHAACHAALLSSATRIILFAVIIGAIVALGTIIFRLESKDRASLLHRLKDKQASKTDALHVTATRS